MILRKFFIFCILTCSFTFAYADFSQELTCVNYNPHTHKLYVSPSVVCLNENGIFLKLASFYVPIKTMSYDEKGIYVSLNECPVCHCYTYDVSDNGHGYCYNPDCPLYIGKRRPDWPWDYDNYQ